MPNKLRDHYQLQHGVSMHIDDIKHKLRKLKKLERKIRFGGDPSNPAPLVWDGFFSLRGPAEGNAKYSIDVLVSMDAAGYRGVIDDYFAYVYYVYYRENGLPFDELKPPAPLEYLDLPQGADPAEIKKRFRELAKKYHPDTGGDAEKFIALKQAYDKLV